MLLAGRKAKDFGTYSRVVVFRPRRARQRGEGPAWLDKPVQDTVNNMLEGR